MRRRVSAEVADAGGFIRYRTSQIRHAPVFGVEGQVVEMPVLAIKAVERTGMGKYRQVLITVLGTFSIGICRIPASGSARAHPVADAVCRQWIEVPGKFAL